MAKTPCRTVGPGKRLAIDYMSSFHQGKVVVFTISEGTRKTMYLMHLDLDTPMSDARLARHLADNLNRATVLRTFDAGQ